MLMPVISLAFLIVIASTAMYTPLLLYVFDLRKVGWLWEHGALFSAMISSTDAVAVSAILKKGEAPCACVWASASFTSGVRRLFCPSQLLNRPWKCPYDLHAATQILCCAAGAPERLCVLMEGESLFNDSSSIVLFKIFFDMVKRLAQGKPGSDLGMGAEALSIATNIIWLTIGQ